MRIQVKSHPNAKQSKVKIGNDKVVHVYTTKPPVEGKANEDLVNQLADYFQVKKNKVMLISGNRGKAKIFEITT